MKFKSIIESLKKRVVLIPLGSLAAIATIIGVIYTLFLPKEREIDQILKEYIELNTKLDRYQLPDNMVAADSTLQLIESIQDNIELYIKSVSKISHKSTKQDDKESRGIICRQNLMILIDSENTSTRCRDKLKQLTMANDSIIQNNIIQYITYEKLNKNLEAASEFNHYLREKGNEIDSLKDLDEILIKTDEIFTSDELLKNLTANKEFYTDLYDNLNTLKIKYLVKNNLTVQIQQRYSLTH